MRHPEGTILLTKWTRGLLHLTFNKVRYSEKQTEWPKEQHGPLAQWLELSVHIREVEGSSPLLPIIRVSQSK